MGQYNTLWGDQLQKEADCEKRMTLNQVSQPLPSTQLSAQLGNIADILFERLNILQASNDLLHQKIDELQRRI